MKRLTSILLALALIFSMNLAVFAQGNDALPNDIDSTTVKSYQDDNNDSTVAPIIEQVYGGGGKGETPISNSFIELYNPSDKEIDLSGYTLSYDGNTLVLKDKIPAEGYYLIIGKAEETTDDFLTYDLPDADLTCDWVINNKEYTISILKGDTAINTVTAKKSDSISKQKSFKRNDDGVFQIVVWEKGSATVDDKYIEDNAPRNRKGEYGSVHTVAAASEFTPVVTNDVRVEGYYNSTGSLNLELAGRHNSGAMNGDGGSLEIVTYNPNNGYAYAVSGIKGKLLAIDLNSKLDGEKVEDLKGTEYDVKALVEKDAEGFTYGDMTSVAVSPDRSKLAVAIQAKNYTDTGVVALFSCNADGSLTLLSTVSVGVQPDMLTFAGNDTILTADEGEPREEGEDPKGSVTIIKVSSENSMSAKSVYFDDFDEKRDELTSRGVLVQKGKKPSTDFEPEYIAVSGNMAYVSLQEENAIAVLDITSGVFSNVYPLGFQDYGVTKVDLEKNDKIELKNYKNVYGIKMPDGISAATIGGKTYLLTANEGDSRADWPGYDNEWENKTSPTGNVTLDYKVVWFKADMWDGLDDQKDYVFGGRSFSIYEVTANGLNLVFDSGSDFEQVTAEKLPDYFNASNDKTSFDNRSGKKGPEPESVVTGTVGGKTYAFIAIERIGGVMVYDITDPGKAKFANYINSREFDEAIKGDVSPEGLCFVSASDSKSGNALLLTACEVSGTLAVYECKYNGTNTPGTSEDAPQIIEGDGVEITSGDSRELSFRSNADFEDFIRVELDGKTLDTKYYTAKPGSIIVTLNADYVSRIPAGTHTIGIVSENGTATATFTVEENQQTNDETDISNTNEGATDKTDISNANENTTHKTNISNQYENNSNTDASTSPHTGDTSNGALWGTLFCVCALGIVVCGRRKKAR